MTQEPYEIQQSDTPNEKQEAKQELAKFESVSDLRVDDRAIMQLKTQYDMFRKLQEQVLEDGVDYGYPARRRDKFQKPSLYKSGAEKLTRLFNLIPKFEIIDVAKNKNYVMYEFKCSLYTQSGQLIGEGFGSCNSEEKDGWKKNPLKYQNNIMKIAKKRAHVDATLTGLGASNVFTQDIEDMDEEQITTIANETYSQQPQHQPKTKAVNTTVTSTAGTDKQLNYINSLLERLAKSFKINPADILSNIMSVADNKPFTTMSAKEKSAVITFLKMLTKKEWNPATRQIFTMKKNILKVIPELEAKLGRNFEDDIANLPVVIDYLSRVDIPDEAFMTNTEEEEYQEPPF
jgi:hypothetical protein